MILFHNIGSYIHSNYNSREQVKSAQGPTSFDGIYLNVYENRDVLEGKEITFFIMGDYIGGNNDFDLKAAPDYGLLPEKYCDWDQLRELRDKFNCRLGWHTKSHRDLRFLPDDEVRSELERPKEIEPILAYPFGNFDDRIIKLAIEMGYEDAWSVHQGNGDRFQRNRYYYK